MAAPADLRTSGYGTRQPAIDAHQIAYTVPRRMRQGRAYPVEVWIERPPIAAAPVSHAVSLRAESVVARAIAVRLKPITGRFAVEAASPETQWDQSGAAGADRLSSEAAVWRFTVTPLRSGRGTVQVGISARTLGADGVLAETQLPDQTHDVRISPSYGRIVGRALMAVVWMLFGMVLVKMVEGQANLDFYFMARQFLRHGF